MYQIFTSSAVDFKYLRETLSFLNACMEVDLPLTTIILLKLALPNLEIRQFLRW